MAVSIWDLLEGLLVDVVDDGQHHAGPVRRDAGEQRREPPGRHLDQKFENENLHLL